ncbi:MAG: CxxxxCH/CxxCH domain-containing protein [Desulfobacteraceae bacterium]|nr:CxxxxCH/CxxCH domain-containing protein [Desulfobacteraceae bacterium]
MNRHYLPFLPVLLLHLLLMACSAANPPAPADTQAHVQNYLLSHGADAAADLNSCKMCHKSDLSGGTHAVSCLTCHPDGEPITIHPLPYADPADHGPAARRDQRQCLTCHGTAPNVFDGGLLADPNGYNAPPANCSAAGCHPSAGAHPTRWQGTNDITPDYISSHRVVSRSTIDNSCALCHQVSAGGTQPRQDAPSCFSATFTNADGSLTTCHPSGPSSAHPLPYIDPLLHGLDAKADLRVCQPCHAIPSNAGAGGNPRFNVPIGDYAAGCESCHAAHTAHPTPLWTGPAAGSHKSAGQMATACALCHGTSLNGSAGGGVGPACTQCHSAGSPLVLTNCASCHNSPPDGQTPAGNQAPNRNGGHGVHDALAGVTDNCDVCHLNAGTNTPVHYNGGNPAAVTIASAYNAQSGGAIYNSATKSCANTRCHGGQATPNWNSGTLNVNTACLSCHTTSAGQYNSATSGRHRLHVVTRNYDCTACHSAALLAPNHFSNLATTTFEGAPWNTLNSSLGYNHATRRGCLVGGCHSETMDW